MQQQLMAASISEASKQCYLRNLRTLQKLHPGMSVEDMLINPTVVIDTIQKKYPNPQTRKAMSAAIKALFKHCPQLAAKYHAQAAVWNAFHSTQDQTIAARVMNSEMTEKERDSWVSWDHVLSKQRELSNKNYASDEHLLLSMYTLIEPLRQDFGNVAIIPSMPRNINELEGNYMVVPHQGPATIILSRYKTQGSYGVYHRELPVQLTDIVRASLQKQPRGWLFLNNRGEPFKSNNAFTQWSNATLERIFRKRLSVTTLRHSFISSIDFNRSTPMQLMRTSRNMAHSLVQQQLYRRRPVLEGEAHEDVRNSGIVLKVDGPVPTYAQPAQSTQSSHPSQPPRVAPAAPAVAPAGAPAPPTQVPRIPRQRLDIRPRRILKRNKPSAHPKPASDKRFVTVTL